MYRPSRPFTSVFMVLQPTNTAVNNRIKKTYPNTSDDVINASYVTYGGTEEVVNGVLSVIDTGIVETWYRPDIKADTRLKNTANGKVYEVLGEPENIEMRNQFLKFKVRSVRGSSE